MINFDSLMKKSGKIAFIASWHRSEVETKCESSPIRSSSTIGPTEKDDFVIMIVLVDC